ncbi:MAG: ROK family protein [Gaiellaceae bacterium]
MNEEEPLYGAIEAGGSKFRVAIANGPRPIAETTIPTTSPGDTIDAVVDFLRASGRQLEAVGIAAFGPLDLDPSSKTYGSITQTPKPGWSGTPLKERIETALGVPVTIETDVGGAALGEWRLGAARGLGTFVYLTVGTGIGGGLIINGRLHHGLGHPEMGHIAVAREPGDDFDGVCPFHRTCLEGMASGPAISARWGKSTPELREHPKAWQLEARYLAQALRTYMYVIAPQRFILGGGVMEQDGLLGLVRDELLRELAHYGPGPASLAEYVVAPELGQDAGLIGALALAQRTSPAA